MRPNVQRLVSFGLLGMIGAGAVACGGPSASRGAAPSGQVWAMVDGQPLSSRTLSEAVAATDFLQGVQLGTGPTARRREARELAQEWAVEAYALRHHWVSVARARREAALLIRENVVGAYGGKPSATRALSESHLTWKDLTAFLVRQMELDAAFAHVARSVRAPSPAQVYAYYQKHLALFRTPAQDQVRTMMVPTRQVALQVSQALARGAAWQTLARQDGRGSAKDDGYHWVDQGPASGFSPAVYRVMDALHPGQVGIARTRQGYAVIEVAHARPAKVAAFGAVKGELADALTQEAEDAAFQAFSRRVAKESVRFFSRNP
ncbi:MAG: peptidyl-prolyl cis-trans isomerase [Firmicutes bacterium]|nr:peptidyl-prolyl cis-trans isomerase [Bacillota bacterium]